MRDAFPDRLSRLTGVLLGTALGDALGLPSEGMSAARIHARWGKLDRFRLFGATGFVSDDTEQAALVAEALLRHPDDPEACATAFRRALVAWFFRLPFGAGLATIRSCTRATLGLRPSGVPSAGNGAAMRSAVLGVYFSDQPALRRKFGRALARVTHVDQRAVEGALYVVELAAVCTRVTPDADRSALVRDALQVVAGEPLSRVLERALALAESATPVEVAARELGTSGYVVHTVAFATFCFVRFGHEPLGALSTVIGAGGDTDSIAAILGGWVGALHGEPGLPMGLIQRIHDGPYGPSHLRKLAAALAAGDQPVPRYSAAAALARNLALYPVIIGHGFRRLIPL